MGFRFPTDLAPGDEAWLVRAAERLPALIHRLPPDQQHVVIGCFFDGRSLADLARDLDCPSERVETLLRTALRTLRGELRN